MKKSEKANRFPIFSDRFRQLRDEYGANTEFAAMLGITRQSVGSYCNGDRIPDALTLRDIAEKCGVSSDWLLGQSDIRTNVPEIGDVCRVTGLSEDAVKKLSLIDRMIAVDSEYDFDMVSIISDLICDNMFLHFLQEIGSCRCAHQAERFYDDLRCQVESRVNRPPLSEIGSAEWMENLIEERLSIRSGLLALWEDESIPLSVRSMIKIYADSIGDGAEDEFLGITGEFGNEHLLSTIHEYQMIKTVNDILNRICDTTAKPPPDDSRSGKGDD